MVIRPCTTGLWHRVGKTFLIAETDLCLGMEQFQFIGGTKKALDQRPFLQMDYATVSSSSTVLANVSRVQG